MKYDNLSHSEIMTTIKVCFIFVFILFTKDNDDDTTATPQLQPLM